MYHLFEHCTAVMIVKKITNCFNIKLCTSYVIFDRARKIFEFHLARWASNPQFLLARDTFPFAQVFKLIKNS